MMNRNKYAIVFDFETDSKNCQEANIIQIGAVGIDLRNLEIDDATELNIMVCPDDVNRQDYYETHAGTINWHAERLNKNPQDFIEGLKTGMKEKDAWTEFLNYCKDLSPGQSYNQMPIAAGHNIRGFDLPICERYKDKYNTRYPFMKRDVLDSMELMAPWLMFASKAPKNLKLGTLCEFFELEADGLHDALFDVRQTAKIVQRFLKFYQYIVPRVKVFKDESATVE